PAPAHRPPPDIPRRPPRAVTASQAAHAARTTAAGRSRPRPRSESESHPMPRKSTRLTFAVLATGAGVFSMLQSLIAPALPTVQHALHTSQSPTPWVMTAYLLSASVCTPIIGRVGDLAGKKRTLVAVLLTVLA